MIGQTLGHYRLVARLGAGGMGVVYRARDDRLERDLALKVLPAGVVADETSRARLLREARMASALNHPNICHVYEVGEDEGNAYIAMELVEGRTLAEAIAKGGVPIDAAIRYGAQIADALAHAHGKGVIHRDLKSANVVITPEGRAKVLDFGLAKRVNQPGDESQPTDLSLTQSGVVIGTPHYIPPEVVKGAKADERSDLWALGVVLYEMASGALPFKGRTVVELCTSIANDAAPPLPARVPAGLRSIIEKCLAKEPAERYRSAGEAHAALSALRSETGDIAVPPSHGRKRRAPVWAIVGAAAVLGLAFVLVRGGALGSRPLGGRTSAARSVAAGSIRSLAVLPLANLSRDPEQEFFADGMTEELITNLAPISSLKVISRTSVMRYKGTTKSIPEIGRELNVDGVIEGSVLRSGDRVRITAQLIDAKEDRHIWAKSYDRELHEVLTLQREVAMDIASMIRLELSPAEHARMEGAMRAVNPEANDLYLRGRYFWGKFAPDDVARSIELFQKAIAIDPGDPRFHAGLADAYLVAGKLLQSMPASEAGPKMRAAAEQALALDETSADAHCSMGAALFFADWDWEAADRHLRRALELNPNHALAHVVYAATLEARCDVAGAITHDIRAREIDPLSLIINFDLGTQLMNAGRFDEALAQAQRTLEIDPTSILPQSQIIRIHEEAGEFEAALDGYEKWLPEEQGGKHVVDELRAAYRAGGASAYWRRHLDLIMASGGANEPSETLHLASLHARLGESDKAFALIERAITERSSDVLFLRTTPGFASLRDDPRLADVVRRVGLPLESS